jgi:electron transport complex protein RnfD
MAQIFPSASAPHIRTSDSVSKIMLDVIIALIPAVIVSVIVFGWSALVLCLMGVVVAEALEIFIMKVLRKKKDFTPDGSAAVTGLLLAMNIPAGFPWYLFIIGIVIAIGLGKHVYGGLGSNPFNPALVGRVFLVISFPAAMGNYFKPGIWKTMESLKTAASPVVTGATPMGLLKENGVQAALENHSYMDMFLGNIGGALGEVSALALIIGFIYLLIRKHVSWHIPVAYIGTVLVISSVFYLINPDQYGTPLYHLLGGGLMLGALFMATDMVTSPSTVKGSLIYGMGCGIITMLIRIAGALPEGVAFSILIMNAVKPLIDKWTRRRPFGALKKGAN